MEPRQLQRCMRRWREVLGLHAWNITIKYVKPWKIDEDCTARSDIDPYHQKVLVEITDPKFHNKEGVEYETVETLVVHELLHIRLFPDGVAEGTPQNLAIEQGINYLARLLIGSEG